MIETSKLLEQFLGGNVGASPQVPAGKGDFIKGAAAEGLLGLLPGSKKVRKMAGAPLVTEARLRLAISLIRPRSPL